MASIQKRPSGKWRARYRDDAGKEHSRHFPRKIDAQRWLDEVTASVVTGQYVDPRAGTVTVNTYAERWREIQNHRPTTRDQVRTLLKNHVYPSIGAHQIKNVRPSHIQEMHRAWENKGLALSSQAVIYRHVSALFKSAVADRLIPVSPCQVSHPTPTRKKTVPLRTEETLAIINAVPLQWRAMLILTAGTGMRQGECFGLTIDRLDLKKGSVTVDRQLAIATGTGIQFGPPKTPSSVRDIPLPKSVVEALEAHLQMFAPGPHGVVFTAMQGGLLRSTSFNRSFRKLVKSLGIEATFHDFRHYYASLLIRHGESVKTVQARLGHKSATETLDTYSHLWEDSDDRTRSAVDEVLCPEVLADSLRTVLESGTQEPHDINEK